MKTPEQWRFNYPELTSKELIAEIQNDARKDILEAEKKLSDAYLKLRALIPSAFDTPYAPTPEQVYKITEKALQRLIKNKE